MIAPIVIGGACVFALGLLLVFMGGRGQRVDNAHYCRRCGYEETVGSVCPECGRSLKLSSRRIAFDMNHPVLARIFAVTRQGRRTPRWGIVASGALLLFIGSAVSGSAIWMQASQININTLKPMAMVFSEAASSDLVVAQEALDELERRDLQGELSPQQYERWQRLVALHQEREIAAILAAAPTPRVSPQSRRTSTSVRRVTERMPRRSAASDPGPVPPQLIDVDDEAHESWLQEQASAYREELVTMIDRDEAVLNPRTNEIRVPEIRAQVPAVRPVPSGVVSILDGEARDLRTNWDTRVQRSTRQIGGYLPLDGRPLVTKSPARAGIGGGGAWQSPLKTVATRIAPGGRVPSASPTSRIRTRITPRRAW